MQTFLIILLFILGICLVLVVGVRLLCGEIRGLGEGEANRGGAEAAEGDAKNAQQKMADRKMIREIENWRDGK